MIPNFTRQIGHFEYKEIIRRSDSVDKDLAVLSHKRLLSNEAHYIIDMGSNPGRYDVNPVVNLSSAGVCVTPSKRKASREYERY